jgi:NAD-dependent SIR2 family protein deacetylase
VGKLNQYTCNTCYQKITTEDIDEGVTPMLLGCRYGCGGTMLSHMYQVDEESPTVDYEWYKPSLREARRRGPMMLEHVKSGGLDIRKKR